MSDQCRDCNDTGGFEGIPASQCPACGKWLPECVDPKWTTRPPNEALDYKPSSYAALYFKTDDPEGKQRMRECLDAPRVKLVLWHLDQWLREQVKHGLSDDFRIELGDEGVGGRLNEDEEFIVTGALSVARKHIYELCTEYNIDLED